jgi:hypothetical protein
VITSCFHNNLEEDINIKDNGEETSSTSAPKELPNLREQQSPDVFHYQ